MPGSVPAVHRPRAVRGKTPVVQLKGQSRSPRRAKDEIMAVDGEERRGRIASRRNDKEAGTWKSAPEQIDFDTQRRVANHLCENTQCNVVYVVAA